MGKMELSPADQFRLATAADYMTLVNLREKLETINPERGSPHAEAGHCIGGILEHVSKCTPFDMELVGMQLVGYAARLEAWDKLIPEENLRVSPCVDRVREQLEKFTPVLA